MRTFSIGRKVYSTDMLIAYVNLFKVKSKMISLQSFINDLNFHCWSDEKKNKITPNMVLKNPKRYKYHYERIIKADLSYPIIKSNGYILDGMHRLTKAIMKKKKTILSIEITSSILKKFLITDKGLSAVDYNKEFDIILLFNKRFCLKNTRHN